MSVSCFLGYLKLLYCYKSRFKFKDGYCNVNNKLLISTIKFCLIIILEVLNWMTQNKIIVLNMIVENLNLNDLGNLKKKTQTK